MAARASGPPGGAQVITTFNGGNVVSTQVPSLNFDGQNAGDLIKTITGIQPNMVSGVTLDNTFVGHQQYRYLPYPVNNRTMTFQWTTPNWCHFRDINLCIQLIFRMSKGLATQGNQHSVHFTKDKIKNGGYHMTNGGILSIFQNMRIKLGAQVDIFTAFEKTKSAYHILNSWLRGKWDQKDVFALIDRWDAWYGCNYMSHPNPITANSYLNTNPTKPDELLSKEWDNVPFPQSDCVFERLLSRTLANRGLICVGDSGTSANEPNQILPSFSAGRITEFVENVSISFDKLHSLFQQNAMLPPGTQIIMEVDLPMYTNYDPMQVDNNPANALWSQIGWVAPVGSQQVFYVTKTSFDDITFQPYTSFELHSAILCAVNQTSVWNSIVMNCVNLKPEIARSLQDERIKRPLVYNYHQQIATTVGSFFPNQNTYNFTLPPNQAIPTQFLFAWVNPTGYAINAGTPAYPGSNVTSIQNRNRHVFRNQTNVQFNNLNDVARDQPTVFPQFDNTSGGSQQTFGTTFYGTSLTPLPVTYKRMIVRRGGFQEVYQYGTYYDGMGANKFGFNSQIGTGTADSKVAIIQNAVSLFGVHNLTPDPSQKYFDHLEEYQFDRKSLNGLGPIERRTKYSYTPAYLAEGKWQCFQLNPCKHDTGQYSSDQNAYTVDVQLELDLDWGTTIEQQMGLSANSKLVCVRIMPAQLSYAIDGTVRIYTWPNLLISPNAVVSGNPPPAGPGGSV